MLFLLHKYVIGPETVNWAWGDWDEWSECTISCGIGGIQTRTRFCIPPKNGGHPCPSLTDQDTQPCNIDRCPGRLPICNEYDFSFFTVIKNNFIYMFMYLLIQAQPVTAPAVMK